MLWSLLFIITCNADPDLAEQIATTKSSINDTEKQQREVLSSLFNINRRIKEISKRKGDLNAKLMQQEARVRLLAQDVQVLERKTSHRQDALNKRLRQLYQEQKNGYVRWLFSSHTPVELERNHHIMKLMIDSDHQTLKGYLRAIRDLKAKRGQLKGMVAQLAALQRLMKAQELELGQQMEAKSAVIAELRKSKDLKLNELKDLRQGGATGDLAFFERKGSLKVPVQGPLVREYGTYVDPQFRFRLMHKGWFFAVPSGEEVRAIYSGKVVYARSSPYYGRLIMLDHGDSYHSVYGFLSGLKVTEGQIVNEGDVVATAGDSAPLFGPGLYFEIRHFADAIDPRQWIKEPNLRTADTH